MKKVVLFMMLMCSTVFAQIKAPKPTSSAKILAATSHSVTIGWAQQTQNPGETVASTNIYRGNVKIANVLISAPLQYVDTSVLPGTTYSYSLSNLDTAGNESIKTNPVQAVVPNNAFTAIRVKPMLAYTDSTGAVWSLDTSNCTGGNTSYFPNSISKALPSSSDGALYQRERWQPSTCTFPVPAGTYEVTVKESENFFNAAGKRLFNILINGATVQANFDIFATAAASNGGVGQFVAVDKTYPVTMATAGNLVVQFTDGQYDNAKFDAIQILTGSPAITISIVPSATTALTGTVVHFGVVISGSNTNVTWSANAPNGAFTATVPGNFTVTVTSVADPTKSASATIAVSAPPITLNCAAITSAVGGGYAGQIITVGQTPSGPACSVTIP